MCIWSVSAIDVYFESIDDHIASDDVVAHCKAIYKLLTGSATLNPKVSTMPTLKEKLHSEMPDLTVASFLKTFEIRRLNLAAKEIHEKLHG